MPAKPLRIALGSLLIQKQYGYSDEELVEQLRENPYYQYFIGMPGYEDKYPFVPSLLVKFRKRLSEEIFNEVDEIIISSALPEKDNSDDNDNNNNPNGGNSNNEVTKDYTEGETETANSETLILDATCAPQNIEYPQDVNLLNKCREKLEKLIDRICYDFNYYTPRMYRENARKNYLSLAKCKKRTAKRIRNAVKQLQYVRRDLKYVDEFLTLDDIKLTEKQTETLDVICKVYEQQKFMFDNKKHSVKKTAYKDNTDRIEVERKFNLAKRKFGIGLLCTKLKNTTEASILLSVITMNIDQLAAMFVRPMWILLLCVPDLDLWSYRGDTK